MKEKTQILIYTFHKCASMFIYKMAALLAHELHLSHYSTNNEDQQTLIRSQSWAHVIENTPGPACFGPIRIGSSAPNFPTDLSRFVVIGHVRDPRDVLTSGFYSFAYSHEGIDPVLVEKWRTGGVDTYVLEQADEVLANYTELLEVRARTPHMRILKYSQLVADYPGWLAKLFEAMADLAPPPARFLGLLERKADLQAVHRRLEAAFAHEFEVSGEDIHRHKRQITPGDHKRKLAPETIEILNSKFARVLNELDYPL